MTIGKRSGKFGLANGLLEDNRICHQYHFPHKDVGATQELGLNAAHKILCALLGLIGSVAVLGFHHMLRNVPSHGSAPPSFSCGSGINNAEVSLLGSRNKTQMSGMENTAA